MSMLRASAATMAIMLCVTIIAPQQAVAQDEEMIPYTVDLVDVSASPEDNPSEVLGDLLGRAGGMDHQMGEFERANEDFDLALFADADTITSNKDGIARAMRAAGMEILIVIDLIEDGNKLRVVSIGPDGALLDESFYDLKTQYEVSEDEGKLFLRAALTPGIPAADEYRENPPPLEEPEETGDDSGDDDDDFGDDDFDDFGDDEFGDDGFGDDGFGDEEESGWGDGKGVLPTSVTVGAGLFFGRRDFELTTNTLKINQFNPLVGTAAHLRAGYGLSEDAMQVGLDADFAYAPFGSAYVDPESGESVSLEADFVRGGGVARFDYAIWPFLTVGAHAGADVLSITVESNATYTGHRYIWAKAGASVSVIPLEGFVFGFDGSALPILSALSSGDAYGVGSGGFGGEFGVTADAALGERLTLHGEYRFTTLDVSEYADATPGQGNPDTQDRVDSGMIALGVSF